MKALSKTFRKPILYLVINLIWVKMKILYYACVNYSMLALQLIYLHWPCILSYFQKPRLLEKQQENTMCTLLPGQYIFYFCKLNFYKIPRLSKQINQSALLSLFSELFQKNSPLLRHFVFHCISNKKFRI